MTEQSGPQRSIADMIRRPMLTGLQDAQLIGPPGTTRINEWVDWIAAVVAGQIVLPIAGERDAFADRVDTLSEVGKRNKQLYRDAAQEAQQLKARVAELEAELARLRSPAEHAVPPLPLRPPSPAPAAEAALPAEAGDPSEPSEPSEPAEHATDPTDLTDSTGTGGPVLSLRDRLRSKYPATAEALDRRDAAAAEDTAAGAPAEGERPTER
ncbi:hypothetical protein [Kitasatospora sp. NPDC059327]|uniref:hypothetical protein n=1 Tax=Kitasatospora sp. NPDC059327 TaxID=3346803 RepID=UPI00369EE1F3